MNSILHPIPVWMKIDQRPLDAGIWQEYGFGYSRVVDSKEVWRPATRCFVRKDRDVPGLNNFREVKLLPGAYWVSDYGRVFSCIKNAVICKRRTHKRKYLMLVDDQHNVIRTRRYRLTLDNFVEPPATMRNIVRYLLPDVNHLDGNPWNDKLDNIQYASKQSNIEHRDNVLRPARAQKKTNQKKRGKPNGKKKHNA